jgi:hypothetical protein
MFATCEFSKSQMQLAIIDTLGRAAAFTLSTDIYHAHTVQSGVSELSAYIKTD